VEVVVELGKRRGGPFIGRVRRWGEPWGGGCGVVGRRASRAPLMAFGRLRASRSGARTVGREGGSERRGRMRRAAGRKGERKEREGKKMDGREKKKRKRERERLGRNRGSDRDWTCTRAGRA